MRSTIGKISLPRALIDFAVWHCASNVSIMRVAALRPTAFAPNLLKYSVKNSIDKVTRSIKDHQPVAQRDRCQEGKRVMRMRRPTSCEQHSDALLRFQSPLNGNDGPLEGPSYFGA
jgi:hypothetical protein